MRERSGEDLVVSLPVLIGKHVDTRWRARRTIGQHLEADSTGDILCPPLLHLLSVLLGVRNVFLQPLVLLKDQRMLICARNIVRNCNLSPP